MFYGRSDNGLIDFDIDLWIESNVHDLKVCNDVSESLIEIQCDWVDVLEEIEQM